MKSLCAGLPFKDWPAGWKDEPDTLPWLKDRANSDNSQLCAGLPFMSGIGPRSERQSRHFADAQAAGHLW